MKINAKTKISHILKASPEALETIVALSPKFVKLRNPLLRKIMAPRVNIEEAARMGGCKADDFFVALRAFGFVTDQAKTTITGPVTKKENPLKPDWLQIISLDNENEIKTLDVRPVIAGGKDPLEMIMKSFKENSQNTIYCIINSFEPIPLITLLRQKGYVSYVEYISPDEVHTYFKREKEIKNGAEQNNKVDKKAPKTDETENFITTIDHFNAIAKSFEDKLFNIDVRQLEMPLPMLTILENLEQLPAGSALYVHHKKVPLYLLPELEERGFEYHICEVEEGNVKLLIYKKKTGDRRQETG